MFWTIREEAILETVNDQAERGPLLVCIPPAVAFTKELPSYEAPGGFS